MTVRWGILGCGEAAEVKSGPALRRRPASDVVAVCRRDGDAAADFAHRHGIARSYADADALIEDPQVDAVYLATPPDHHLRYGLKVCAAGKPLLVERPMGRTPDEAQQLLSAFRDAGLPLSVGYYRRALPRFTLAKRLIDEGRIGRLANVQYRLNHPRLRWVDPRNREWRARPEISGGGFFVDFGCHVVDLIDYLAGPLTDVAGYSAPSAPDDLPEASVAISFRTGSGALGVAAWCFVAGNRDDCLDLIGTEGRMRLRMYWSHRIEVDGDHGSEVISAPDPEHVYEPFVDHVLRVLADEDTDIGTAEAGVRASRVMRTVLHQVRPGIESTYRPLRAGSTAADGAGLAAGTAVINIGAHREGDT